MGENSTNGLNIYLSIDAKHQDLLGHIRHWKEVKLGTEEDLIWVKEITEANLDSVEIRSIPHLKKYKEVDNQLYPIDSRLPERNMPSVLWTPIDRFLQVNLPSFNHNLFEIPSKAKLRLVSSENEKTSTALLVKLDDLGKYIETASQVRLHNLRWIIFDLHYALIIGAPFLPMEGKSFWSRKNMLIPAGFDLEFPILEDVIQKNLNPSGDAFIFWQSETAYSTIEISKLKPLTKSSFISSITPEHIISND